MIWKVNSGWGTRIWKVISGWGTSEDENWNTASLPLQVCGEVMCHQIKFLKFYCNLFHPQLAAKGLDLACGNGTFIPEVLCWFTVMCSATRHAPGGSVPPPNPQLLAPLFTRSCLLGRRAQDPIPTPSIPGPEVRTLHLLAITLGSFPRAPLPLSYHVTLFLYSVCFLIVFFCMCCASFLLGTVSSMKTWTSGIFTQGIF